MPYIAFDPATAAAAPASTLGAPLTSIGWTFADYQVRLLEELGNTADATLVRRKLWINDAYKHLLGLLKMQEMKGTIEQATVAAQPLYLVPSNVRSVLRVGVIDDETYTTQGGRKLTLIDEHSYRMLPDTDAEPVSYFRYGRMLVLYPTPDDVRTMIWEVVARPASLVDDTDSPIVPEEFHEAILLRAKHVGFRALRRYTDAAAAQNDFVSTIRFLRDAEADEEEDKQASVIPIRSARQLRQRD